MAEIKQDTLQYQLNIKTSATNTKQSSFLASQCGSAYITTTQDIM